MDITTITSILMVIGIDIILGGDNAIVIALASRNLPAHKRNKAIYIGTGLAIMIRTFLVVIASTLLNIPFIHGIGGFLLLYIAYKLLVEKDTDPNISGGTSVLSAVKTIVFADLIMGIDNVIAIAGASHGNLKVLICGLLISIPIIIWGSKTILYIIEKVPFLLYIGSSIISFTAGEMIIHETAFHHLFILFPILFAIIPVITTILVITCALISNRFIHTYTSKPPLHWSEGG